MAADSESLVRRGLERLLRLEVSTIVVRKGDVPVSKRMRSPQGALEAMAKDLQWELAGGSRIGPASEGLIETSQRSLLPKEMLEIFEGVAGEGLRTRDEDAASESVVAGSPPLTVAERQSASLLADLLRPRRTQESLGQLSIEELVTLQKVWEVWGEEVAFQTVIHIDGDVVTRVGEPYLADEALRKVHQDATATACAYWKWLGEAVVAVLRLAGQGAGAWFGQRSGS